ncbi:MAG: hypothetical protein JJ879_00330 [Sneathiella sp.]|nr:hypothetical protein [Sneathiella sp.]
MVDIKQFEAYTDGVVFRITNIDVGHGAALTLYILLGIYRASAFME